MLDFIKGLGLIEILIIVLILVVLFGGKKFKELSRGLGESTKEIKKVKKDAKKASDEISEKDKKESRDK